jgi:hypothetical protein
MGGRQLTRAEVLAWNNRWSQRDRDLIAHALDVMPEDAEYEENPSRQDIGVWVWGPTVPSLPAFQHEGRPQWHRGLVIYKGRLKWPGGLWSGRLDPDVFPELRDDEEAVWGTWVSYDWYPLSTLGHSGSRGSASRQPVVDVCEGCNLALPPTGTCDYCD